MKDNIGKRIYEKESVMQDIEKKVEAYRKQLIKEAIAIEQYKFDVGREPCCARQALTGDCVCWQDRW